MKIQMKLFHKLKNNNNNIKYLYNEQDTGCILMTYLNFNNFKQLSNSLACYQIIKKKKIN